MNTISSAHFHRLPISDLGLLALTSAFRLPPSAFPEEERLALRLLPHPIPVRTGPVLVPHCPHTPVAPCAICQEATIS